MIVLLAPSLSLPPTPQAEMAPLEEHLNLPNGMENWGKWGVGPEGTSFPPYSFHIFNTGASTTSLAPRRTH